MKNDVPTNATKTNANPRSAIAGRVHGGGRFGSAPRVEELRGFGMQARDRRPLGHGVARIEVDALDASGERRRDDEAVVHAGVAVLVDGHGQRTAGHRRDIHGDGRGPERHGGERAERGEAQQPGSRESPSGHRRHSRDFSTATRSSPSRRRRTATDESAAALTTVSHDHAMLCAVMANGRRYTSLLKMVMMKRPSP